MDAGFVRSVHSVLPSFIPSKNDSFCWRGRWTQFARRLLQRINRQRTTANQVTFYSATVQPGGKPMALDHFACRNTPTLSCRCRWPARFAVPVRRSMPRPCGSALPKLPILCGACPRSRQQGQGLSMHIGSYAPTIIAKSQGADRTVRNPWSD